MGKPALIDTGYYKKGDGLSGNNYNDGYWTGKDGVYSKADFLKNAQAQEKAMTKYTDAHWTQITKMGLDRYVGKNVDGVIVTKSGMLATSHLLGVGGLRDFLKGNNKSDANGTTAKDYMSKVSDVDTDFSKSTFSLSNQTQKETQQTFTTHLSPEIEAIMNGNYPTDADPVMPNNQDPQPETKTTTTQTEEQKAEEEQRRAINQFATSYSLKEENVVIAIDYCFSDGNLDRSEQIYKWCLLIDKGKL